METVATTQARLEGFIQEYCAQPSINLAVDLSPGSVLSELLIKLSAELHNQLKNDAEIPSSIATVQAALSSVTDTYSESIDAVASNYNTVRDTGVLVTGKAKVKVAYARTYYIGSGFQLVQPSLGVTYSTTQAYQVDYGTSAIDDPTGGKLKLYSETVNGPFYFLLPVANTDAANNVSAPHNIQLQLNAVNTVLDGFISATAYGNFTSGRPLETDRSLIARFQSGLSTKGLLSTQAMQTHLPVVFPGLFVTSEQKAVLSAVGATDAELTRGKYTTYGITPFGLADVYVRTSKIVEYGSFQVLATYQSSTSRWLVTLDASTAVYDSSGNTGGSFPSWFYNIVSVSYVDRAGTVQQAPTPDITYSADPDASNQLLGGADDAGATAARFTKYQVCDLSLSLTLGGLAPINGETHFVTVMVSYMPSVGDIQDYMLQDAQRVLAADYLVKAVVPCNLAMNLSLQRASSASVDVVAIKNAIFEYINTLPFGESVVVSRIVDICHNYNVKRVDLPVSIKGSIFVPSTAPNDLYSLSGEDLLAIPYSPLTLLPYGVSSKTTAFFIDYQNVLGEDTISITLN